MSEFYVMHGPRGQVQTVTVGGQEHVALWADMLSALRYKARHPELLSYWTVPLDRRLYETKFLDRDGGRRRFYLMSGADPGLEVSRGRVVAPAEVEAGLYSGAFGGRVPAPLRKAGAGAPSSVAAL
jgi:hypothetical protein